MTARWSDCSRAKPRLAASAASRRSSGDTNGLRLLIAAATVSTGSRQPRMAAKTSILPTLRVLLRGETVQGVCGTCFIVCLASRCARSLYPQGDIFDSISQPLLPIENLMLAGLRPACHVEWTVGVSTSKRLPLRTSLSQDEALLLSRPSAECQTHRTSTGSAARCIPSGVSASRPRTTAPIVVSAPSAAVTACAAQAQCLLIPCQTNCPSSIHKAPLVASMIPLK